MSEAEAQEDNGAPAFDVDAADTAYVPSPPFSDWSRELSDEALWDETIALTQEARSSATEEDHRRSVEFVFRAAAVDTGAIEGLYEVDRGFTYSVAAQAAAWETAMDEKGADVRGLFEAQLRGYELVLDAVTQDTPIVEAWIRSLHVEICAAQSTYRVRTPDGATSERPLPKGQYKTHPNHVLTSTGTVHSYAPVDATPAEMHRLVTEISAPDFQSAHPVIQAAYAHYSFIWVHPFADGNGRVARALASVFLYHGAGVPLLIFADRKNRYLDALEQADTGYQAALNQLVMSVGVTALNLTRDNLRTAAAPKPADVLAQFRKILTAQRDLTHEEMDAIANRAYDEFRQVLLSTVQELPYPPGVDGSLSDSGGPAPERGGFRSPHGRTPRFLQVTLRSAQPAEAEVYDRFWALVASGSDEMRTAMIVRGERPDEVMLHLDDVYPDVTAAARTRFQALADRTCGELLVELLQKAREALMAKGYSPS